MKTEKMHFTAAEIHESIQSLIREDVAVQTYERAPTIEARSLLNDISRAGFLNVRRLWEDLADGGLSAPAIDARENDQIIRAIDVWIDTFDRSPMETAAALVAQIPHAIASGWRRRESAQDSILNLRSALYQLTALQLEADFRWIEETATEGEDEFPESPEELEEQRVKDLEQDRLKLQLIEKYMDRDPIELAQFDGWDIGPEPNGHMTPDEGGHWICGSTTQELRRSPKDLRVRIFIPIDTDPRAALVLTRKLAQWIEKIADSGKSFREELDWGLKIRNRRKQRTPWHDGYDF